VKAVAKAVPKSVSTGFEASEQLGALPPLGFWDPLGFSKDNDEEKFNNYRAIELKHGRIAQLAVLGVIVQYYFQLPDAFDGVHPIAAFQSFFAERPAGVWQILIAASMIEVGIGKQSADKPVGDIGFGESFKPADAEEYEQLQLKELNNGRLAMVGFTLQQIQEATSGEGPLEQLFKGF